MAHHKSNKAVEGNPESGHSRGMPGRPDEDELQERTALDREEVGLPADPGASPARTDREAGPEDN